MLLPHRSNTAFLALTVSASLLLGSCDDESVELPRIDYVVGFNLEPTTGPVGALQIEVEYLGANGAWAGNGGGVACRWIVDASLHACNDKDADTLSCAVVDSSGFTGPTPLMECDFLSRDDTLTAADFDVRVVESSGIDLAPIDADVTVTVDPSSPETTTTIDPDNPPQEYEVTFTISDDGPPLLIGALQLDIGHAGARGSWIDTQDGVDCRWLVSLDIEGCNEASNRLLKCAAVSQAGFSGDGAVLSCGFASYDPVLVASDFDVAVVDASGVDLAPIEVFVFASSVTERQSD